MEDPSLQQMQQQSDGPSGSDPPKIRVALLVNVIAPYRIPVYNRLAHRFDLTVLFSGQESNRAGWDDELRRMAKFAYGKVFGWTLKIRKGKSTEGVFDYRYIHLNPGYFTALFKLKPKAVITNELGARTLMALIYGFLARKPVWVWWGGTPHSEREIGRGQKIVRKLLIKRVPHWISYGQEATQYLLAKGVRQERIVQIQNCVDHDLFHPDAKATLDLRPKPIALHVGQYIGRKGIDEYLDAAAKVQGRGHDFTLLFVGRGPEEDRLKERAATLSLKNVVFHPPTPTDQMPGLYASADFLVFPTKEDIWGLVVNEGILSGLPVLSSIYGGVTSELVPEGNRFDPLDPDAFANAFEKAVQGKLERSDPKWQIGPDEVARRIGDDIERNVRKRT